MKLINITKSLAAVLLSVGMIMTSCSTDWPSYSPTSGDVTFQASSGSFSLSGTPVTVTLQRGTASAAESVPVTLTDTNNVFTMVSKTADFAAGSYTADVQLSYTSSALTPGDTYAFSLAIDSKVAAPGAIATKFDGTAMLPFTWEDYGTISWTAGIARSYNGNASLVTSYKLQKAKYTTAYYRVVNAFGGTTNLDVKVDVAAGFVYPLNTPAYCGWFSTNMVKMVTGSTYKNTAWWLWLDQYPEDQMNEVANGSATGNALVVGSAMTFYCFHTYNDDGKYISSGGSYWLGERLTVTAVK
ncbi:MAG: hypothetical protein LKM37_00760 [Bacteroidales bacterium]|nr:hypothetical protein [Bacteroidales bacterium]